MSILTALISAAAEVEHHDNVMLTTFIFGVIAFVVFIALALVTFSYRDVANRHAHKAEAYAQANAAALSHGAGHGH